MRAQLNTGMPHNNRMNVRGSQIFLAFLLLFALAAVGWKITSSLNKERSIARAGLELQNQSLSSTFETAFESAEQTLTGIAYRFEYNADKPGLSLDLRRRMLRSPSLTDLRAYGPQGNLIERAATGLLDEGEKLPAWVRRQVEQGKSTGFGEEKSAITFFRVGRDKNGKVLGTALATLGSDYFQSAGTVGMTSPPEAALLVGPDGQVLLDLANHPSDPDIKARVYAIVKKASADGTAGGTHLIETDDFLVISHQLRNVPIRVVQLISSDVAYAHWRSEAYQGALLAAVLIVAMGVFALYARRNARLNLALMKDLHRMTLVIEQSPVPIVMTDLHAQITFVNPAYVATSGYSEEALLGANPRLLQSGKTSDVTYKSLWKTLQAGNSWRGQLLNRRQDGSEYWEESFVAPLRSLTGDITHYFAVQVDVTDRLQLEDSIRAHDRGLETILENSSVGICQVKDRKLVWLNRRMAETFGYAEQELVGVSTRDLYPSNEAFDALGVEAYPTLQRGERYCVERQMRRRDGSLFWVRLSGKSINASSSDADTIWIFEDISQQKDNEYRLALAASVFTSAREGILITDANACILDVNDTFTQITGYTREDVLGANPRILNSGRQSDEFYRAFWAELNAKGHWSGELWNRKKNGAIYPSLVTVSAARDSNGHAQSYVALFSDITAIKNHEQELERIAHFDALTGLPNRILLADRMQQAMARCQRYKQTMAVVFLDLDGFKQVNDLHGHESGDALLVELSRRMASCLRDGDTLARLGGDEFVAILGDLDASYDCVQVLVRLLAAVSEDVFVNAKRLSVTGSLGVALYPHGADEADLLIRQADQAMYAAKQAGKNRYHFFDTVHDSAVKQKRESVESIQRALDRGELLLMYQPKVNLQTRTMAGAEALIRWQHPERGLLLPGVFLPKVEGHPLSVKIGEWVIRKALQQMEAWRKQGLHCPLSVNIGAMQIQQDNFPQRLGELLSEFPHLDPSNLELEVLETSAMQDLSKTRSNILTCQSLGIRFALDDFGTGYSSLTYLKHLPVETLKIDQSFVRDMLDDPSDMAIVKGVIGLAEAFGRKVVAEGVESRGHQEQLLSIGCYLIQGYAIARPMPPAHLPSWKLAWETIEMCTESSFPIPHTEN